MGAPTLKLSRELALWALHHGGRLTILDPSFRADREAAFLAVRHDGLDLEFCAYQFKDEFEIVNEAILNNPNALQHASSRFRKDKCLVKACVGRCGAALQFADAELQSDSDVALLAIRSDPQ